MNKNKELPLTDPKYKYEYSNFAYDCGKLTLQEYAVYNALIRHLNVNLYYAYPSYDDLMEHLNITSRNTLNKHIKSLEEKGFIIKIKGKLSQNNRYYFVNPNDIDVSKIELKEKNSCKIDNFTIVSKNELTIVSKNDTLDVSKNDTLKENIKENNKRK